jgi:hypothetical protein
VLERYQLPAEVQERLEELREVSKRAEDGDKDARKELRQKLRESSPAVIARASDVSRRAQHMLIGTVAAGDPLTELALSGRLDMMREEIAGEAPTPLEALLAEQVVSCWLWLTLLGVCMSGQYQTKLPDGAKRVSPAYIRPGQGAQAPGEHSGRAVQHSNQPPPRLERDLRTFPDVPREPSGMGLI